MSRGPGRVSRAALRFIQASDRTVDAFEVAAAVYAVEPEDGRVLLTLAQVVAVRRALAELVRRGAIRDMGRIFRFGRRRYASHATFARYDAEYRAVFGKPPEFQRPVPSKGRSMPGSPDEMSKPVTEVSGQVTLG